MSDTQGQSDLTQIAQAFAAMRETLRGMGEVMIRGMSEFWASPEGQWLRAVADYYNQHPGELDVMIEAREVEATRESCHCLCGLLDHLGACTSDATERVEIATSMGPMPLPVCGPCATGIESGRTETIGAR